MSPAEVKQSIRKGSSLQCGGPGVSVLCSPSLTQAIHGGVMAVLHHPGKAVLHSTGAAAYRSPKHRRNFLESIALKDDPGPTTEAVFLTSRQAEAIVRVAEAAPALRRRYQYFVWTQSQMQTLLPHQILLCGAYLRQRRDLVFEAFNSIVLPTELLQGLTEPRGPLLSQLMSSWIGAHGRPLRVTPQQLAGSYLTAPAAALAACGIDTLLVHGVARPQRPAEIESLFVFGNSGGLPGVEALPLLEVLVPYLHWSWLRVVASERDLVEPSPASASSSPAVSPRGRGAQITDRERQVLSWVREGKNNQQIGEALSISPLTVKNHVHKILKKLDSSNRAQAVAEALARGLLPNAASRRADG